MQGSDSPVDNVNVLLAQANLPLRVVVEKAEIKASQNGSTYSVARMSDGERTALVTIAEVVSAPAGAVFVIDEPELHLHRAIIVPLIKSLVVKRHDCTFVVSTHELDLAAELPGVEVAIVRGCHWKDGIVSTWDIDLIPTTSSIPEDVRVDVLGSRRKILFIEGTVSSLDHPMYALLFPAVSVRARESCREVMRAVAGLRGTEDLHRARAFGLIDSDGMDNGQVSTFEAQGIYPLGVFSIESLYYSPELINALAERQAETAATDPQAYIDDARARGLVALTSGDRPQYLASRVAERKLRDAFLSALPVREELTSGNLAEISVSVPSTYPAELDRLKEMASTGDLDAAIERYPVRESGVLDAIAKALHFPSRADYEKAALARLSVDSDLLAAMRSKLGALATVLL
ncbi:hypothetical protein X738_17585 [Mesorhizobium sp. LNHC209A00]|nr:hypothetical protein X738_17585 [Mesorhizobium sp. LNHC209A00]